MSNNCKSVHSTSWEFRSLEGYFTFVPPNPLWLACSERSVAPRSSGDILLASCESECMECELLGFRAPTLWPRTAPAALPNSRSLPDLPHCAGRVRLRLSAATIRSAKLSQPVGLTVQTVLSRLHDRPFTVYCLNGNRVDQSFRGELMAAASLVQLVEVLPNNSCQSLRQRTSCPVVNLQALARFCRLILELASTEAGVTAVTAK